MSQRSHIAHVPPTRMLKAIQQHIKRNFKRWFKTYSNIEGIHAGEKSINNKKLKDCHSIVFHVTKKTKRASRKIPDFLIVSVSKNKKVRVPTDVIETGRLKLNGIKIGD